MTSENEFYEKMWAQKAKGQIIKHNDPLVAVDELAAKMTTDLTAYVTTGQMSDALLDTLTTGNFATIVTKDFIASMNLIVGNEITMGPNATIEWLNVLETPTIPTQYTDTLALQAWVDSGYKTYIDQYGVYTGTLRANNLIVGASGEQIPDGLIAGATTWNSAEQNAKAYADIIGQDLQTQIDGSITTWFYGYVPTLVNAPANTWATDLLKNVHLGDLFYDTTTGYVRRFALIGTYQWILITDTDVTKALADASRAQDTADGKRRVFVVQPIPPYDIGDLWSQGTSGDLMRCATAKTVGQVYVAGDWVLSSKYTDNTVAILAQNQADLGVENALIANNLLADIADDNKFTPSEKQNVQNEWGSILSEKILNDAQADVFAVSKVAYGSAYTTLSGYITPLLASLVTTSDIVATTFRANFKDYYDERTNILNVIATKSRTLANAAQTTVDALTPRVSAAEASLIVQAGQIVLKVATSTYTTKMTNLDGSISTINTSLGTQSSSISVLQDQIVTKVTQTDVDTSVNAIQIGGRNLFLNSSFNQYLPVKFINGVVSSTEEGSVTVTQNATAPYGVVILLSEYLQVGETYTLSLDIKTTDASPLNYISPRSGASETYHGSAQGAFNIGTISTTGQYTRYSIQITVSSDIVNGIAIANTGIGTAFTIRKTKIEKGNKATDWTPAPEDVQLQIDLATTRITMAETTITQNTNSITLKASQTSLNTTNSNVTTVQTQANLGVTNAATAQTAANLANTNVTALTTRVTTAESTLTIQAGQIVTKVTQTDVDTSINAIEIGGRNLLQMSDTVSGYELNGLITSSTAFHQTMETIISIKGDSKIIYQCWNPNGIINSINTNRIAYFDSAGIYLSSYTLPSIDGSKYQIQITTPPIGAKQIRIGVIVGTGITIKVEEGNKATEWTPAPEDVQSQLDLATTRISTAETTIVQNTNLITLKASQTSLNTTDSNVTGVTTRMTTAEASIVAQAGQITLKASQTSLNTTNSNVTGVTTRMTTAEATIVTQAGQITLKASQTSLNTTNGNVTTAQTQANLGVSNAATAQTRADLGVSNASTAQGTANTANSTANTLKDTTVPAIATRVTTAEASIVAQAGQITLKASQTSLDTTNSNVTGVTTRMTTAEASIVTQAGQISTKVDVAGVKSTIQQSASDVQIAFNAINSAKVTIDTTGLHVTGGSVDGTIISAKSDLKVSSNVWNSGTSNGITIGGVITNYDPPITMKYSQGLSGDGISTFTILAGGAAKIALQSAMEIDLRGNTYVTGSLRATTLESTGNTTVGGSLVVGGGITANGMVDLRRNILASDYSGSTNVDHLWHDDSTNTWHFCSDTTVKSTGNSNLRASIFNGTNGFINVGKKPAFTWSGSIALNSSVLMSHNLGYRPITEIGGSYGNLVLSQDHPNVNQFRLQTYSSGGNTWAGSVYFY